jgi:hypothetical protein
MRVARRAPLSGTVSSIQLSARGEIWLGAEDGLLVVDTLGGVRRRLTTPGMTPRLLADRGERVVVSDGALEIAVLGSTDTILARRRARRPEPVAADLAGQWVYTTHAWGSVLGLDSLLVTRWGWPDGGARATALAVGPIGDRVYVALAEGRSQGPQVLILEAWSGRVMGRWESGRAADELAFGPDPRVLYARDSEGVVALRHVGGSLLPLWRVSLGKLGMDSIRAVRPSPDGGRLAVLGRRGDATRLAILSAVSGRDTARWNGAPPDVAWDGRGRLVAPVGRELLWLR